MPQKEDFLSSDDVQGHPERVLKVNHVAGVFIFTKNQFSQLFLQEK